MKPSLPVLLILCSLTQSLPAQQSAPTASAAAANSSSVPVKRTADGKLILADGTALRLRLLKSISSKECEPGHRIDFEVMEPVILDGVTVVQQGALAWGGISLVARKRALGSADKLVFELVAVELANSESASLRTPTEAQVKAGSAASTGAKATASIALYGLLVPQLFTFPNSHANIPAGKEITGYINGDKVFDPSAHNKNTTNGPRTSKTPAN